MSEIESDETSSDPVQSRLRERLNFPGSEAAPVERRPEAKPNEPTETKQPAPTRPVVDEIIDGVHDALVMITRATDRIESRLRAVEDRLDDDDAPPAALTDLVDRVEALDARLADQDSAAAPSSEAVDARALAAEVAEEVVSRLPSPAPIDLDALRDQVVAAVVASLPPPPSLDPPALVAAVVDALGGPGSGQHPDTPIDIDAIAEAVVHRLPSPPSTPTLDLEALAEAVAGRVVVPAVEVPDVDLEALAEAVAGRVVVPAVEVPDVDLEGLAEAVAGRVVVPAVEVPDVDLEALAEAVVARMPRAAVPEVDARAIADALAPWLDLRPEVDLGALADAIGSPALRPDDITRISDAVRAAMGTTERPPETVDPEALAHELAACLPTPDPTPVVDAVRAVLADQAPSGVGFDDEDLRRIRDIVIGAVASSAPTPSEATLDPASFDRIRELLTGGALRGVVEGVVADAEVARRADDRAWTRAVLDEMVDDLVQGLPSPGAPEPDPGIERAIDGLGERVDALAALVRDLPVPGPSGGAGDDEPADVRRLVASSHRSLSTQLTTVTEQFAGALRAEREVVAASVRDLLERRGGGEMAIQLDRISRDLAALRLRLESTDPPI